MNLNMLPLQVYGAHFPLMPYATELYLPFLKMPLLAYQESETTEQRIAWLFRAIADINNILACHEEQLKDHAAKVKEISSELVTITEKLEAERAERIEADEQLQANIDAETAARIAADEQLQADIDTNTASIQNLDGRVTTLEECCENVKSALEAEEAARIAADNTLNERIDNIVIGDNPFTVWNGFQEREFNAELASPVDGRSSRLLLTYRGLTVYATENQRNGDLFYTTLEFTPKYELIIDAATEGWARPNTFYTPKCTSYLYVVPPNSEFNSSSNKVVGFPAKSTVIPTFIAGTTLSVGYRYGVKEPVHIPASLFTETSTPKLYRATVDVRLVFEIVNIDQSLLSWTITNGTGMAHIETRGMIFR